MDPIAADPAEILRTIPLFAKLTDEELAALAKLMVAEHHHPLSQIVKQGDLGNRFFIIASGTVSMRRTTAGGAESVIGGLMALPVGAAAQPTIPKNYFGEQMFSSQEPYDFHADAVTSVDVYRLHRKEFNELVKAQPQLVKALTFIRAAERKRTRGYGWVGEGEAVILVVHKHWWALVPGIIFALGLAIVVGVVAFIAPFLSLSYYTPWIALLGLFVVFGVVIFKIIDWYNDEYIVTNQRIARVERNLFFQQELRDTALMDKVQGVGIERAGLSGIFLRIGKLVVQTPGREQGNVEFDYVGNPEKVRVAILGQQEASRARLAAEAREQFRATVRGELTQYLAPDLAALQTAPQPPLKKKRRTDTLGKVLQALSSPFNLELHYSDRIVWRKHWSLLIFTIWRWLGLQAVLIVFYAVVSFSGAGNACLLPTVVIFLGLAGRIVYDWVDWSNDIYAVTETQIIDSERSPFGLTEKTMIAPLDQITDVVVDIPGIIATILDYGTLKIDTAGKTGQMTFKSIHAPRGAQEEIYTRIAAYKTKRAREDASIRSASVVDAILAYHRLQQEQARAEKDQANSPEPDSPADSAEDESKRVWKTDEPKLGPDIFE